jgi:putative FmdB family regulatory protein
MPLFEYLCKECGHEFERIVPRYDSRTGCPRCASNRVEKQLSVFSVSGGEARDTADTAPGCGRCGAPEPGMCQM